MSTVTADHLGERLALHLEAEFMDGQGGDFGVRLLAAIMHFHLRFSRLGKGPLPRAWRALKGRRKSA